MSELITCPSCDGDKQLPAFVSYAPGFSGPPVRLLPCPECDGVGSITQEHQARKQLGESMRKYRTNALQLGLREAADKWGMRPSVLSMIEQGKIVSDWRPPGFTEKDATP
jgi:hypothetical protein